MGDHVLSGVVVKTFGPMMECLHTSMNISFLRGL